MSALLVQVEANSGRRSRFPATIGTMSGQVGDCAGMAADLLETMREMVDTMVLAAIFFAASGACSARLFRWQSVRPAS